MRRRQPRAAESASLTAIADPGLDLMLSLSLGELKYQLAKLSSANLRIVNCAKQGKDRQGR